MPEVLLAVELVRPEAEVQAAVPVPEVLVLPVAVELVVELVEVLPPVAVLRSAEQVLAVAVAVAVAVEQQLAELKAQCRQSE